jgi:N-methylhydantoinase B
VNVVNPVSRLNERGPDGVRMAILSSRMDSIARKMQNTLFRTARSGILNTAHDFSCVVLTADCRLLAAAESLPTHTLVGPDIICRTVRGYHPQLKAGDCFLHNSPYEGNSHAADYCLVVPVIDPAGVLRYWVLAKAHQADCGNSKPSTYLGDVIDVYNEGALIFSAIKIQENYQDNADIVRMCKNRIRVPEVWWGDYLASLGAVCIAERELLALGADVGWDALDRYAESWFDYSEARMVEAIRRLRSGRRVIHTAHDPFPGVPDGIPVKVDVEVDTRAATIVVDLTDNPDCQPCGLNLTESTSISAAMVGIYNGIVDHHVPANAGSFRRINVKVRENCAVGIPAPPLFLLRRHDEPRRPGVEPGATRHRGDSAWLRSGRDRPDPAAGDGGDLRQGPAQRRRALRQPGACWYRRGSGDARHRRLPVHYPCRQCGHVPHRLRRGRRARPPDARRPPRHCS